jgi:hypothetical protein
MSGSVAPIAHDLPSAIDVAAMRVLWGAGWNTADIAAALRFSGPVVARTLAAARALVRGLARS